MLIVNLAVLAVQCSGADLNQPYQLMQEGFHVRSPQRVAEAYHDEAVIGGQTSTRVVAEDILPELFGYVRPPNGEILSINFRIVSRGCG